MPRDGSGIYSIPLGTDGVPDQTIESTKYNGFAHDVEQDLNFPRPIVVGGTGATNAHAALIALHGEEALQVVVNYDTFPFVPGSFYSAPNPGTPTAPNGHAFSGICYQYPLGDYMTLEARDMQDTQVPARMYVRQKLAGVWGPWTLDTQTVLDAANNRVLRAGDTMTGDLAIGAKLRLLPSTLSSWNPVLSIGYVVGQPGVAIRPSADPGTAITFVNSTDTTTVGTISTTTTATAYNTSSDIRLKTGLEAFDAGRIVDDTEVYSFRWKATGERSYGVSAQQANEVFPQAVTRDEQNDLWLIDYSKYVPVLINEIKALRARVAQLEAGVASKPA